jgi:hypothetical protein
VRAYVPATLPLLARWWLAGAVAAEVAFAVTPAVREAYAGADTEELEYAALTEAARASLALLAADPTAPRRRVVLAVDAPGLADEAGAGPAAVRMAGDLTFDAVAAVHIDDVTAGAGGEELLWYATQEIPDLLAGS